MQITGIKETCIYVADLEATRQFYSEKLGLPVISVAAGRHIFFRAGDSVLLCFIAEQTLQEQVLPPHGAQGIIHFAFEVTSAGYSAALLQIRAHDIEVIHEHLWPGGVRSFYFHDPDGNLVEIIEPGLWEK